MPLRSPPPSSGSAPAVGALRQCPTPVGNGRSLIIHRIDVPLCQKRQREHYHKCHRCQYRGMPADFVAEEPIELAPIAETGIPTVRIDLPPVVRDAL